MSDSKSRRADLHYRLDIKPGVPVPTEVVALCYLKWDRKFPRLISRAPDGALPLRPGWIVPLYLAVESLSAVVTAEQREKWLPVSIVRGGWRLSYSFGHIVSHRIQGGSETIPKVLTSINRKFATRVRHTCSSCGGPGRFYPSHGPLLKDVLCRKCAAPRQLIAGLEHLMYPKWEVSENTRHVNRAKLPSPWRQSLLHWAIGSGLAPSAITPDLYRHWLTALTPAATTIVERGAQYYADSALEGMHRALNQIHECNFG